MRRQINPPTPPITFPSVYSVYSVVEGIYTNRRTAVTFPSVYSVYSVVEGIYTKRRTAVTFPSVYSVCSVVRAEEFSC